MDCTGNSACVCPLDRRFENEHRKKYFAGIYVFQNTLFVIFLWCWCIYIYIYIYVCMYLCVCVCVKNCLCILCFLYFVDRASGYNRVKKTNLPHNLRILNTSIFHQPLYVSGISRPIIRRCNCTYTTIGTYYSFYMTVCCPGPSSGGTTVSTQQLVLIILFRWLLSNQDNRQSSKKNRKYQLL